MSQEDSRSRPTTTSSQVSRPAGSVAHRSPTASTGGAGSRGGAAGVIPDDGGVDLLTRGGTIHTGRWLLAVCVTHSVTIDLLWDWENIIFRHMFNHYFMSMCQIIIL